MTQRDKGAEGSRRPVAAGRFLRRRLSPAELVQRRETYRGYGDTMTRAFEFVLVPVIFGAVGWALDRWLGIAPVLMLALGAVAVVGLFARAWYGYDDAMRAHEAELPSATRPRRA